MSAPTSQGMGPVRVATQSQLEAFLHSASSAYDVRVPIALHDGTRALAHLDDGPLALSGGAIPSRPNGVFFPHSEKLFSSGDRGVEMQPPPDKPLLVVGLSAQDADCLTFIDSFFEAGIADDIYWKKRKDSAVVVLSGRCGERGAFLKMSNANCDMEWVCDGKVYLILSHTEKGRELAGTIAASEAPGGADRQDREDREPGLGLSVREGVTEHGQRTGENGSTPVEAALRAAKSSPAERLLALKKESDGLPSTEKDKIRRASQLLREKKVPEAFWQSIADRCIACTACNLVCPTCTCFDLYDWQCRDRTDRCRVQDSCQTDGFMREASGHNPLGTEALRTRRRIHHKLVADVARWGRITCFCCGRCDAACPAHIGIVSVCTEIVEKYG